MADLDGELQVLLQGDWDRDERGAFLRLWIKLQRDIRTRRTGWEGAVQRGSSGDL